MTKKLNLEFEKAVRLLAQFAPVSDETSRKPLLPHDIRVGVYLYEHGYSRDVVLAGVLHDALEFTDITEEMIREQFGDNILRLVKANTKDDSITDPEEKTNELISRCVEDGEDALIVKAADILDSFKFYTSVQNEDQLDYCRRNARAIFKFKTAEFNDKIFDTLKEWIK